MQRTIINPLYRDTVTFLETSGETNGRYSLMELVVMPGGGNPPHYHTAFTETFTAVKGTLGIRLPGRWIYLQPGEQYTVPVGATHNFFNPGKEEITCTVRFSPGHEGMENLLRIAYGLASDGLTNEKGVPKSLSTAALIMEMGNSYPTGFLSVLRPLFSFLAKQAKKKGLERRLIDQYCN